MGKKSSLSIIVKFIEENNLIAMKPWSQRFQQTGRFRNVTRRNSSSFNSKLIKKIRKILLLISGNDMITMIKGILRITKVLLNILTEKEKKFL